MGGEHELQNRKDFGVMQQDPKGSKSNELVDLEAVRQKLERSKNIPTLRIRAIEFANCPLCILRRLVRDIGNPLRATGTIICKRKLGHRSNSVEQILCSA
jgi:hypothetical protein